MAGATYADLSAQGRPLAWVPSPGEIYRNGRAIDRDVSLPPLTDDGAEPNQVWRAVREFGVRAMGPMASDGRYSDADPATVNDEPKLGDLEAEALELFLGDYGITTTGTSRIADVRVALAANKPITIAIAGGSDAFQSYMTGVLPALNSPLDHYVFLWGYETLANGKTVFHGRNSWSESWGLAGDFMLSEAALAELGDLVVADVSVRGAP